MENTPEKKRTIGWWLDEFINSLNTRFAEIEKKFDQAAESEGEGDREPRSIMEEAEERKKRYQHFQKYEIGLTETLVKAGIEARWIDESKFTKPIGDIAIYKRSGHDGARRKWIVEVKTRQSVDFQDHRDIAKISPYMVMPEADMYRPRPDIIACVSEKDLDFREAPENRCGFFFCHAADLQRATWGKGGKPWWAIEAENTFGLTELVRIVNESELAP